MRVCTVRLKNFGPYESLEEFNLSNLTTIIGQNDAGKSHILRAIQIFLEGANIEDHDIYNKAESDEKVVIDLSFASLPESIELEEGIPSAFEDEMLTDSKGHLRILKTYSYDPDKSHIYESDIYLIINDFSNKDFSFLASLKRDELDELCRSNNINIRMRGQGATNKSKRDALRTKAREIGILKEEQLFELRGNLKKSIFSMLPRFRLFEADVRLSIDNEEFQSSLSPVVDLVANETYVLEKKEAFARAVGEILRIEIEKVFEIVKQYTDAFSGLNIRPNFNWQRAITFDIEGDDEYGTQTSINHRGSGFRRLFMVAFFQYLAEKESGDKNFIYAIEEPENCLHPRLQRELVRSLYHLANQDYQIILTSHSPVFVGESALENLALVTRVNGNAKVVQHPNLNLTDLADQLGIEPSDQITTFKACIFVEGINDIIFWKSIASKFKEASLITETFEDKNIGFIPHGGDNLKNWLDIKAMSRLIRNFAVVIDSDLKSNIDILAPKKLEWKTKCEAEGGKFFILKKRAIENYIHPDAIIRSGRIPKPHDDFTEMKKVFDKKIFEVIKEMSCDEILRKDYYEENGRGHNELKEIVDSLLSLTER